MLGVGEKFPSFSLVASVKPEEDSENAFRVISDLEFPDHWKVYFFWPKDFTAIAQTELVAFTQLGKEFDKRDAQVMGCSTDSELAHRAWRNSHPQLADIPFPMLADIKRELCAQLAILDPNEGIAQRATFIVSPEGIIQFAYVTPASVGRNPEEVLRVLDALQSGQLCPSNWHKGEPTLQAA